MNPKRLQALLEAVADGEVTTTEAEEQLRYLPFFDLGFAKVDHHRELRVSIPEAVYAENKSPEQVTAIVAELMSRGGDAVLVTRASPEQAGAVASSFTGSSYHQPSRLIVVRKSSRAPDGVVAVLSAGTSDFSVADEAALTADALALKVERISDVGVAGLHRLLAQREVLTRADVLIVAAGMDGALASIVGGLVAAPVIAVPTSVGYGAGAGGIAPLLTMLNSCSPGVAVVNIDNGFGAAVLAAKILRGRT